MQGMMRRGDHAIVVRHQWAPLEVGLELWRVRGRREHEIEIARPELRLESVIGAAQHMDLDARLAGSQSR
jgi:hypothetical protein